MFWSGNYIAVRELNFLLKEENVTLTQVLEADDILQECKADNKALMQFLTKPKILAELITLITEEPPKNVELASQYRHASIACEVLTSHLSSLSDRLSMDVAQMNRLCDFINKDPPLNPLLASYFSKTVEMLLERSPKQDWYLYHIVCLRVLDFFKSRRDFLPNLLRHISTSAIADTFKYFIRLDDLFNKIIMEWFEEHQFLECLIQIVCGTYAPEPAGKQPAPSPDRPEKGQQDLSEKGNQPDGLPADTGTESVENNVAEAEEAKAAEKGAEARADSAAEAERASRIQAVASANAAALLCDLILSGCAGEGCNTRPRTSWALVSRLQSAEGVRLLLQGMFTAPPRSRPHALVHGAHVLLALLDQEPILGGECESERTSVELAVAPHLPLLHQALLEEPGSGRVGLPRVQVAALLAHLALSEVEEVATTMLTLGTPGVLVEMMFAHPNNNFLHAQVYALVKHALGNRVYGTQYARHLLREAGLLARLMDAFEHNEAKQGASARAGYMGHVVLALRRVGKALEDDAVLALLPPDQAQRWQDFREGQLAPVLQRHDKPLGGFYPSENIYEMDLRAHDQSEWRPRGEPNDINDINADAYNEMCTNDSADFLADELDLEDGEKGEGSKNNFLELASQRFDDDMWEDTPEADAEQEAEAEGEDEGEVPLSRVRELLEQHSPWESSSSGGGGGEGWAQFEAFASAPAHAHAHAATPSDPFAPQGNPGDQFAAFWSYTDAQDKTADEKMEESMRALRLDDGGMCSVELASKLLSCMSNMMLPQHTGLQDGQDLQNVFDNQNIASSRGHENDIQGVEGFPADSESSPALQKDVENHPLAEDDVKTDKDESEPAKDIANQDKNEVKQDKDKQDSNEAQSDKDEIKPDVVEAKLDKNEVKQDKDDAKLDKDEATAVPEQTDRQQVPEPTEPPQPTTPPSPPAAAAPPPPQDPSPPSDATPAAPAQEPSAPAEAPSPPAASPPAASEAQR